MPKLRGPKSVEAKQPAPKPGAPTRRKVDVPFSPMPIGMTAGFPFGLNPDAIREVLKRVGMAGADDAVPALRPTSKALKDIIERRSINQGPPVGVTERRYEELMKKFGGTKIE